MKRRRPIRLEIINGYLAVVTTIGKFTIPYPKKKKLKLP